MISLTEKLPLLCDHSNDVAEVVMKCIPDPRTGRSNVSRWPVKVYKKRLNMAIEIVNLPSYKMGVSENSVPKPNG